MDDKRLGQNKVLCSFLRVKLPSMQAPQRSLRQENRSSATYRIQALKPHWLGFLHIASSLSPHLVRFLARPVGRPCFYLRSSLGLTVGLAIGDAVLIVGEVIIGLSGWSLWNKLMNFLRCWTAETGSQVFLSSGYLFYKTR